MRAPARAAALLVWAVLAPELAAQIVTGKVVLEPTEAGKLEVWTIDELGILSSADSTPWSVPVEFLRLAISD